MNSETSAAAAPINHPTRKIDRDVIRLMIEINDMIGDHDSVGDQPLVEKVAGRIREERFTERALIVNYLTLTLPDTPETRTALEYVFGGSHRRMSAIAVGSDDGVVQ